MKNFLVILDDSIAYSNTWDIYLIKAKTEIEARGILQNTLDKKDGIQTAIVAEEEVILIADGKKLHYSLTINEFDFNTGEAFDSWYVGE